MEIIQRLSHSSKVLSSRAELYMTGDFSDVTLVSDDFIQFKCHKTVIASSSVVLRNLLQLNNEQHPMVFLKGMKQHELKSVLEYLYLGNVSIESENILALREALNHLQIENDNKLGVVKSMNKLDFLSSNIMDEKEPKHIIPPSTSTGLSFLNKNIDIEMDNVEKDSKLDESYVDEETQNSLKIHKELLKENNRPYDECSPEQNDPDKDENVEYTSDLLEENTTTFSNKTFNEVSEQEQDNGPNTKRLTKKKSNQYRKPESPAECEVCAAKFTTRRSMQRHNKIVHELQTEDCDLCGKNFKGKDALRNHKNAVHDKKRYQCAKCDKDFGAAYLKKHILDVHTPKCDYCKLTFETIDQFHEHIRVEHVNKFC